MSVKDESDPSENEDKNKFYDDLLISINQRPGLFYKGTGIPKLADVRGKIVLIRRFGLGTRSQIGIDLYDHWPPDGKDYFNNYGTTFFVQDAFKGWGGSKDRMPRNKFDKWVLPMLEAASGQQYKNTLFVNFTSGTGNTDPKQLAEGFYFGAYEYSHFEGVNKMLLNHIRGLQHKRYGIIPMDFPESPDGGDLIKKLVTLNPYSQMYRPDLNGQKITNKFTGMVYWVLDGILRYISSPPLAKRIFGENWSEGVRSELNLVTIMTGSPLPDDIRIVRFGETAALYLCFTEPGSARSSIRHIPDSTVLNEYGLHGPIVTLPANAIKDYQKQPPLPSPNAVLNRPDLNGKRIHNAANGRLFLIIDGKLRFIPNAQTANNIFGADWGVDGDINPNLIEQEAPLPSNARIIRFGKSPALYLSYQEPGAKMAVVRHIPSMKVLAEYGLHGTVQTSTENMDKYKVEQPLPAPGVAAPAKVAVMSQVGDETPGG